MFMLRQKSCNKSFLVIKRLLCHKFGVKELDLPKIIEPTAIKDLQILKNVKKVRKRHSFLASLFMGAYDVDYLTYPEVLYSRKEFIELRSQSVMINKYFRGIVAAEKEHRMNQFNFNRLWTISKCETLSILEAIGESLALKPEDIEESIKLRDSDVIEDGSERKDNYFNRLSVHPVTNRDIQLLLFDLILHNCCSFAAIQQSENDTLKQRIISEFERNPHMKIGFAWNERILPLGALPYIDWESEAKMSLDGENWVVNGKKNRIMKQDYDYYLVFCLTNDVSEERSPNQVSNDDVGAPGIAAILLRNDQIAKKVDEGTENGIPYESVEFQHVSVPRELHEVLPGQLYGVTAQNIKGLGQVATASFILGQMKSLLSFVYEYLVFERNALPECEMIQSLLAECTRKIYAIESVTYMVGAMYDCFDHKEYSHIYLEAAAAKIIAVEYAFDIIRNVQSIFGSKLLTTSPFIDLVNILNSFLDGTVHNRILIGMQGLKMVGQFKNDLVHKMNLGPFYPLFFLSRKMKLKKPTLKSMLLPYDFKGYLHPTLKNEGDKLEYCLRLHEYITEYVLVKYAKEISEHQCDVNRLSQIAIHIFELTCVLARASRAYCDGIQNGDCDVHLAMASTQDIVVKVESLVSELERGISETQEYYNERIHNRNMKFKGYFPFPPLDKTFY